MRVSGRWLQILRGGAATLLLAELLLPGCAASGPTPRPDDFPFHVPAPPVDIHWRLRTAANVVRADGLVERRQRDVRYAWVQLLGLDATGRIVSFTTPTFVSWKSEWDSESFTITLRPRGPEQRYDVRLYSFEYGEEAPP